MVQNSNILKNCKGILLDLDHTLYDYHQCHSQSLKVVLNDLSKRFSLSTSEIESALNTAKKKIHVELTDTASSHNRMLYFQRMFEILGLHPLKYSLDAYKLYWDYFLSIMEFDEGVPELLAKLKKDKKICLITDLTVHIQHRKVEKLKLYDYLDHMVSSEEAGREKPHPYIFLLALKKIGLQSSEVCMIGDNFSKDIIGATNLNIPSFWVNRDNKNEVLNELVTEIKCFKDLEKYA